MGLHYDLPVYKSCYDLLLEIFQFTKEFSKEYKYAIWYEMKRKITLGNTQYKKLGRKRKYERINNK